MEYARAKGIYAIRCKGELFYIGKTSRTFNVRWREHMEIIRGKDELVKQKRLYGPLREAYTEGYAIEFCVLRGFHEHAPISSKELEAMESVYVDLYKPICNTMGTNVPYIYHEGEQNAFTSVPVQSMVVREYRWDEFFDD